MRFESIIPDRFNSLAIGVPDTEFIPGISLAVAIIKLSGEHVRILPVKPFKEYLCDIKVGVGPVHRPQYKEFGWLDYYAKTIAFRKNGNPYGPFGLVWNQYGKTICRKIVSVNPKVNYEKLLDLTKKDAEKIDLRTHNKDSGDASIEAIYQVINDLKPVGEKTERNIHIAYETSLNLCCTWLARRLEHHAYSTIEIDNREMEDTLLI